MKNKESIKPEILARMDDACIEKKSSLESDTTKKHQISVIYDDQKISCCCPDGMVYELFWDELIGVAIKTTDEGPFFEDVFWYLGAKDRSLCIPQSAHGLSDLLSRLQTLPDFDNFALMDAMSCTDNKLFICWRRENL